MPTPNWRGSWAAAATYAQGDAVLDDTNSLNSFIWINATPGNTVVPPGAYQVNPNLLWGIYGLGGTLANAYMGEYSSSVTYQPGDIVFYINSTYISLTTNNLGNTITLGGSNANWHLFTATGSQGSTGPTGATGPGFVWRGAWSNSTTYNSLDSVDYTDGSSYVCIASGVLNVTPPSDNTKWNLLAQAGGVGAITTVFGRTGVVVSANGDYNVSQVTGAAPLASPTFTGTITVPTIHGAGGTFTISANTGSIVIANTGGITVTPAAGTVIAIGNARFTSALTDGSAGFGSTGTTGQVLSSTGGGSPTTLWADPTVAAAQVTNKQTIRVPYTTNSTDGTNQYANIPVTFSPAFADANYTISTDLEFITAGFPVWQANHAFAAGAAIIDSNGSLQVTPGGGTSGGSAPIWNVINNQVSPTDGDISDWVLTAISIAVFIGIVKAKTASGFIEEITLSLTTGSSAPITTPLPLMLHVTAWHD